MSERNFSVRRFEKSDVGDVVKLLELVFERPFSTEWWNWKYRLNPAGFWGDKGDIWVAESANGEIIGHWAVMPEKIKFSSKTITVAQAVDAATHPKYRRLGINKTLVRNIFSDIQSRYGFVFSFPREIVYKMRVRQGWESFPIPEFLSFLNYDTPLRSFSNNNFVILFGKVALKTLKIYQRGRSLFSNSFVKKRKVGPVKIQEIDHFPDETDDFWARVKSRYEMCLERTANFLNWRFSKYFGDYRMFLARSAENGDIVGYLVLRKTRILDVRNVLDVVDFQVLLGEDECVLNLLDTAMTIAKNERYDLVHCRVPVWHRYAALLYKKGFFSIKHTFGLFKIYQPRIAFYRLKKEAVFPKVRRWFYTLADTDYA